MRRHADQSIGDLELLEKAQDYEYYVQQATMIVIQNYVFIITEEIGFNICVIGQLRYAGHRQHNIYLFEEFFSCARKKIQQGGTEFRDIFHFMHPDAPVM